MDKPLRRPDTAFTSRNYRSTQKPKRKTVVRDGIDKLENFLDEYSPQMQKSSSAIIALINSILKNDGPPMTSTVGEGVGNKTPRGSLGPKIVDFDKEKEKHTERKGNPEDYVLEEQNDIERKIRGYRKDEKDPGPENTMDAGAMGSGTVDVAKQFTGWDWKGQQGEYKRGAEKDKIDDNPEIQKDNVDRLISDLMKAEDGDKYKEDDDYVETPTDEDKEILTRDNDSTRGTYTGNNAAYNYTQTLNKAETIKDLKWTDDNELSEKARKKADRELELFNMSLNDVDAIELPGFESNESKKVKSELEQVKTANDNFHENEKNKKWHDKAIEVQDDELFESFIDLARVLDMYQKSKDKLNLKMESFKALRKETGTIILRMKLKYNRPRPAALLDYHGVKISPKDLPMARTPSYPSGHACQAKLIAMILSKKYPQYEKRFMSLSKEIAQNRVIAGVHFPSDSKAGWFLADEIYDKLNIDKLDI